MVIDATAGVNHSIPRAMSYPPHSATIHVAVQGLTRIGQRRGRFGARGLPPRPCPRKPRSEPYFCGCVVRTRSSRCEWRRASGASRSKASSRHHGLHPARSRCPSSHCARSHPRSLRSSPLPQSEAAPPHDATGPPNSVEVTALSRHASPAHRSPSPLCGEGTGEGVPRRHPAARISSSSVQRAKSASTRASASRNSAVTRATSSGEPA